MSRNYLLFHSYPVIDTLINASHCRSHDSSVAFISVRGVGSPRASLSEWSYVCVNVSSFVGETRGTFSRFGLVRGVVVIGLCLY
jgi:hypothetical protein